MAKLAHFPLKGAARLLALALPAALLCLAACRLQIPFPESTLRWGTLSEPATLNPILASDAYASLINSYVNDSLIDRDPDTLEFKPELAERWEVSPDHLRYTFYLRRGVRWHDGKPLTAEDVIYSFERIQDPKVEAPFLRVYYADIEKVEKLDDYAVRFTYRKPYFLGLSMCGGMDILPKHIFDDGSDFNQHPAGRHPIGTGPYRFVEWKTNKKIALQRNPDYWSDKPAIERIEFIVVTDDTVMLQLLKKGDLDMAGLRPIQWAKQTGSEKFLGRFDLHKYLRPGFQYIGWNMRSPFFSDRRVRTAMTLLVDREKILQKLKFGLGRTVESPFFVEGASYNENLKPFAHDPRRAVQLLAEAGWADHDGDGILDKDGRPFAFTFLYPSAATDTERLATILKEDLKGVGIIMDIQPLEWAAFLGKIEKKEFEATSLSWSTSFEQDPYQIWHSSQAEVDRGSNFVSFKDPEADQLIERARVEFDADKRNALYWRLQEIIQREQPYTFLFSNYSLQAVSKRFTGVKVHRAGLDPLEWGVRAAKEP